MALDLPNYRPLRVFVASPSDLADERKVAHDVISELNRIVRGAGIVLEMLDWTDVLPTMGERAQSQINVVLEQCDVVMMLLWRRWGTATGDYSSGTEEEYRTALELAHSRGGRPTIALFFKELTEADLVCPDDQICRVQAFRRDVESDKEHGFYTKFGAVEEWEQKCRDWLLKWLFDSGALVGAESTHIQAIGYAQRQIADALVGHASSTDMRALPTLTLPFVKDSKPVRPPWFIGRNDLGQGVQSKLIGHSWVALVGGVQHGKTQLAVSIAESARVARWIDLTTQDDPQGHIQEQLAIWAMELKCIAPTTTAVDIVDLVTLVGRAAGPGALLVVDFLPDPAECAGLYDVLTSVAIALGQLHCSLLTTSRHQIPTGCTIKTGGNFACVHVPGFTLEDVSDILKLSGAPASIHTGAVAATVYGVTGGLPPMVMGVVEWFKRRGWRFDAASFDSMIAGDATALVRDEVRRLFAHSSDPEGLRLLDRLSLVFEGFTSPLVLEIADIAPSIPNAMDRLRDLSGAWIDRFESGVYRVSPLLASSGATNLAPALQTLVHGTVADHYLGGETLAGDKVWALFGHLWAADRRAEAVLILVRTLNGISSPEQARYMDWSTRVLGPGMEWPEALGLSLHVMLRAAQIRVRALGDQAFDDLYRDLDALIAQVPSEDALTLLYAYGNTNFVLGSRLRASVLFERCTYVVEQSRGLGFSLPASVSDLFWISAHKNQGAHWIEDLARFVDQVREGERHQLFASDLAVESVTAMCEASVVSEGSRPADERDWPTLLQGLSIAIRAGGREGAEPLRVAAARAKALVESDYLNTPDLALDTLSELQSQADPDLEFLRHYTSGCILLGAERLTEAKYALEAAAAQSGSLFEPYRLDGRMRLGMALGKLGEWGAAYRALRHLCVTLVHCDSSLRLRRLEALGELALAHWQLGQRKRACGAMYGTVRWLAQLTEYDPETRELYFKATHALGWYWSQASTGRAPSVAPDGGSYVAPFPGMFWLPKAALSMWEPPVPPSGARVLDLVGSLACSVGLYRMGLSVLDEASSIDSVPSAFTAMRLVSQSLALVHLRRPNGALDYGIRAVLLLAASSRQIEHGSATLLSDLSHDLASMTPTEKQSALVGIQWQVVMPAILHALGLVSPEAIGQVLSEWQHVVATFPWEPWGQESGSVLEAFFEFARVAWKHGGPWALPESLSDHPTLHALLYLLRSAHPHTPLATSFKLQEIVCDYFAQSSSPLSHDLDGLGAFMHGYWSRALATQRFRLRDPDGFDRRLASLPRVSGLVKAVSVLRGAESAIGCQLSGESLLQFEALGVAQSASL